MSKCERHPEVKSCPPCARCGAPQCCPKCCEEASAEVKEPTIMDLEMREVARRLAGSIARACGADFLPETAVQMAFDTLAFHARPSAGCEFCRDCDAQRCPDNVRSVLFKIAEQSAKGHYFNVHHHTAELVKVCSDNLRLLLLAATPTERSGHEQGD